MLIGDWYAFGEQWTDHDGYDEAVSGLGISLAKLRNWGSVSRSVPPAVRYANLSWSHHRAVASLPVPQQAKLLAEAAPEAGDKKPRLAVRELEQLAKATRETSDEGSAVELNRIYEITHLVGRLATEINGLVGSEPSHLTDAMEHLTATWRVWQEDHHA